MCGSNRTRLGPFSAPSGSVLGAAGPRLDPAPPSTSTSCPPHLITSQSSRHLPHRPSRFTAQTSLAFPDKRCLPSTDSSPSTGGARTSTQTRPHPPAERSSPPSAGPRPVEGTSTRRQEVSQPATPWTRSCANSPHPCRDTHLACSSPWTGPPVPVWRSSTP